MTKTLATPDWGDAGASSTQSIPVGSNGFVEFSTNEVNKGKAVGLSVGDANRGLDEMDFAILLKSNGEIAISERNSTKDDLGPYVVGDVFRVGVLDGVVRYLREGMGERAHFSAFTKGFLRLRLL